MGYPHKARRDYRHYAAIDLGTNNCRLLIARPVHGGGFVVIDAFSRVVRLGEGLSATGRLSEPAMDRTIEALKICSNKIMLRRVILSRSVATEACRKAVNGAEFIDRVRRETGLLLDIITAKEEARLAVLGCHSLLRLQHKDTMIFDIGGGSTELVRVRAGPNSLDIVDWQSAPLGVVSLTESCGPPARCISEQRLQYERMIQRVSDAFHDFFMRNPVENRDNIDLLGSSGTATTLASVHMQLAVYNRKYIDGAILSSQSIRDVTHSLSHKTREKRAQIACIGEERSELIIGGCAIIDAIMNHWPAYEITIADRGIREGILRSLIASRENVDCPTIGYLSKEAS